MLNKSYYTRSFGSDNYATDKVPFLLNCTGVVSAGYDFMGSNRQGRVDYYFMYLYKGSMQVTSMEKSFTLRAGQLFIFPPNKPYSYKNLPGEKIEYLWFHITGSDVLNLITKLMLPMCEPIMIGINEKIVSLFNGLFDEFLKKDSCFEYACVSKILNICTTFSRTSIKVSRSLALPELSKSLKFIEENYMNDITIKQLSDEEHLSESRYRAVFKSVMGISPTEYISTLRLRNACSLLLHTDLSIKEIAESTGYSEQMYFSRVFTKHFGYPPSVYRKQFSQ